MVSALIFIVFVLIAAALIIIWVKRQNSAPDTYPAGSVLTLHITGMQCEKCSASVMEALNAVNGVHAEVDLKNNCAAVKLSESVFSKTLKEAVGERGFKVSGIQVKQKADAQ